MNSIEKELTHLVRAFDFVKDWSLAIDGGANLGHWSLLMSGRFKQVHAFEPADDTYKMLVENTAQTTNIIRARYALGSKMGLCEVTFEPKRESSSTYHRSRFVKEDTGKTPMVSLDGLRLQSVGLIKLDLEGSEYFALKGAEKTIQKFKPVIIIEIDKFPMRRFGIDNDAAEKLILEWGAKKVDQMGKDGIYAFI